MPYLWDPLTFDNLMAGTVLQFERQEQKPLHGLSGVEGSGVYALYYKGKMAEYKPIAGTCRPIYVGKAVPPGARKGSAKPNLDYPALQTRLNEHIRSIEHAKNLSVEHFSCRVLPVVLNFIVFSEQALIQQYKPVWNSCLDGFGKHPPGKKRKTGSRSWWDTLHPGRPWAEKETEDKTPQEASRKVKGFLRGNEKTSN